jgi:cell division septal protein FtsQ
MFFRRKPRNRRYTRDHILDVKLSAVQRRQTWRRRVTMMLGAVVVLGGGALSLWRGGEWALRRFVYENPAFALQRLDIETDGVIALEQLRAWAGVRWQDNLMALDLGRIKRDLELVPAIESVAVERILPRTLRLRVTEREPIARVEPPRNGGPVVYTVDARGCFMFPIEGPQRATPAPTNDHLPLLTGLPAAEVRPGRPTESPQLQAALRLVQAFARSAMNGLADLKQIDVSAPGVLSVTTGQHGEIVFGLNDPDQQLRRWRAIYDLGQRTGRQLAWLDLSVSNNVPARWHDVPLAAPAAPKTKPPSPYRKKHV